MSRPKLYMPPSLERLEAIILAPFPVTHMDLVWSVDRRTLGDCPASLNYTAKIYRRVIELPSGRPKKPEVGS
jgi:hypothetical protein